MRVRLGSNTTPRFLTFEAGETLFPRISVGKSEWSCLRLYFEPIRMNSVLSGFNLSLFAAMKFCISFRQSVRAVID